ncbi:hypothetical protein JCM33374_g614 [Metschnikowia sp. JCM 33374]|nr:hypothetical protein JCM33374_g614 [Metschnikowia sp. JCM 33374]
MTKSVTQSLTVAFPPTNESMSDLNTHTSYVTKREVDLLPLRRVLVNRRRLRDSVILLNDISPQSMSVLLRIKHVALDFTSDFDGDCGIVPGARFVGRIPSSQIVASGDNKYHPKDKLMVFPYSTCWIQNSTHMCQNCLSAISSDLGAYETHRRSPCSHNLVYGKSLNGGLQDYVRVPLPSHSLVKVPESVSVHDCCFLFDVALPFLSFAVNVLAPLMRQGPTGRILIILDDTRKEANDCLLVIRHLQLDHSLFTFTDTRVLKEKPELTEKYNSKFQHVLVFASSAHAINKAVEFGGHASVAGLISRSTLALFRNQDQIISCPDYRKIYRYTLSYKDKFLLEQLLATLASLSAEDQASDTPPAPQSFEVRSKTAASSGLSLNSGLNYSTESVACSLNSSATQPSSKTPSIQNSVEKISHRFAREPRSPDAGRRHVSWLHCDQDLRLCSDDNCVHELSSRCHQTKNINEMLSGNCQLRRVFYTHRSACHVKLNAFIF